MIQRIPYNNITPQEPTFLAPGAYLIGDVRFGDECSIWFGSVLRGDINYISLGDGCNVQDNSVLHVSHALPCILEDYVSMGHQATAHACVIETGSLIGMGARVLDGARVGAGSVIAAGCVVPEGMQIPPCSLVLGVPGKVRGKVSEVLQNRLSKINQDYRQHVHDYHEIMIALNSASS